MKGQVRTLSSSVEVAKVMLLLIVGAESIFAVILSVLIPQGRLVSWAMAGLGVLLIAAILVADRRDRLEDERRNNK